MRQTALGAWVTGIGWLGVLAGFLLGHVMPALVGAVLVAGAETTRWRLRRTTVQVRRTLPERIEIGQSATIVTEAVAEAPVLLRVETAIDVPLRREEERHWMERGAARHEADVVAIEAGTATWKTSTVALRDPWALHEAERSVPALDRLQVSPESDWLERGRRAGRRHTVQALAKGRRSYETQPELHSVRPFQPGDRLRDVDWARSSRLQSMHSRVRERVMPRPITVLLDATATMRYSRRRAKITTAARIAYGLAAAAQAAGVHAEIVAFDERGVSKLTGSGRLPEAAARLGRLDSPLPVDALPAPSGGRSRREDRGFLGAAAVLASPGAPSAPPLDAAIGAVARAQDQSLLVAILDAEGDPETARHAIGRLRRTGNDVVAVVPANGAHHVRRHEAEAHRAQLRRWARHRAAFEQDMRVAKVPVFIATPNRIEAIIEEVARCAQ